MRRKRSRRERRINTVVFCCTIAMIPIAFWGATSLASHAIDSIETGRPDCDSFEFDPSSWDGDAEEQAVQADGLSECGTLAGAKRREVTAMLGRPTKANRKRLVYELPPLEGAIASARFIVVLKRGQVRDAYFYDPRGPETDYGAAD